MTNNKRKNLVLIIVGAILFLGGLALLKFMASSGIVRIIICIITGSGCMVFGHAMGDLLSQKALDGSPELAEKVAIEQSDERNLALADRSKAQAFDLMTYVFSALFFCFIFMDVELAVFVLLAVAYVFVTLSAVYFRSRLEKKM